jgi:uncharacterized protein (UPF0305 family)
MTKQEQLIEKLKESLSLYREYSIMTIREGLSTASEWEKQSDTKIRLDILESEISALESEIAKESQKEKIIESFESEIKEKDEPKMSAEEFAREHIINGWGTYEGIPLIRLSRFYEYANQFKQ